MSGNGSVGNIVSVSSHVLGKLVAAVWSRGLVREEQSTEEKEKRQEKEGVSVRVCECVSAWVSVSECECVGMCESVCECASVCVSVN